MLCEVKCENLKELIRRCAIAVRTASYLDPPTTSFVDLSDGNKAYWESVAAAVLKEAGVLR